MLGYKTNSKHYVSTSTRHTSTTLVRVMTYRCEVPVDQVTYLFDNRIMWYHVTKVKKLHLHFHKTYKCQARHSGDFGWGQSHMTLDHVVAGRYVANLSQRNATFHLHFNKNFKHETWQCSDFGWRAPTY